jgi:hypothetical protein
VELVMISIRRCFAAVLLAVGPVAFDAEAQQMVYEPVNAADLLGNHVLNGKAIETEGHFWLKGDEAFFNFNQPSARPPMSVDVSRLNPQALEKLRAECSSDTQFAGGCRVIIRGETAMAGKRQMLIAQDIRIKGT